MFKGLGNLSDLLKQAQHMGSRLQQLQQQLRHERAKGSAGGGMVEVEVNGLGELLRVRIEPALMAQGDVEMIEDLIPPALQQAQQRARELHAAAFREMSAGLPLPGNLSPDVTQLLSSLFPPSPGN